MHQGPYKGAEAIIEWMDASGTQAWIYLQEKDKSNTDPDVPSGSKAGARNYLGRDPGQLAKNIMVTVNVHDIRVQWPTNTLSFSKEKGYDVCAGDNIEVARGEWLRSRGVVQRVCFDKGHLDLVCEADRQMVSIVCQLFLWMYLLSIQITVLIIFCHKVRDRLDLLLSRWVGRDVWVIGGEKKGYQATLKSLGRGLSWVALQGHQLIQLKNEQIATP